MRKILQLQILVLLTYQSALACDCPIISFTQRYTQSDLVAEIKIIKNFNNEGEQELYRSDIEIINLYKGESINSIYIAGRSDGKMGSSCSIYIPENAELVAYVDRDADGKYVLGACMRFICTKNHPYVNQSEIDREIEMLSLLKNNNITYTDKIDYGPRSTLHSDLEQFNGIVLNKDYALFEITFAADLSVKRVKKISGFNRRKIDRKLMEMLEITQWGSYYYGIENSVPDDSKLLIGVYYYPKEDDNPSFLSLFDL